MFPWQSALEVSKILNRNLFKDENISELDGVMLIRGADLWRCFGHESKVRAVPETPL